MPKQLVLRAMLAEPSQEMYGLQICTAAGLPSGTGHPILARLERGSAGWNTGGRTRIQDEEGRPRRRYYKLTEDGAERARMALARPLPPPPACAWPRVWLGAPRDPSPGSRAL